MPKPSSWNERLIPAAVYGLTLALPVPLLTIAIAWLLYYILHGRSPFADHHLKQNFNLILSLHLYVTVLALINQIYLRTNLLEWVTEKVLLLGLTLTLGGFSSLFFIIIMLLLYTAVYIALIIFSLLGQSVRVPLIIRFIK